MDCTVVTPSSATNLSISWIEINTPTGNYVIQQGHAPMVATLLPKSIIVKLNSGKQETLIVKTGGVIRIDREMIQLILNEEPTTNW